VTKDRCSDVDFTFDFLNKHMGRLVVEGPHVLRAIKIIFRTKYNFALEVFFKMICAI